MNIFILKFIIGKLFVREDRNKKIEYFQNIIQAFRKNIYIYNIKEESLNFRAFRPIKPLFGD